MASPASSSIVLKIQQIVFGDRSDLSQYFKLTTKKEPPFTIVSIVSSKRYADDELYKKHPELVDMVHRGHHFVVFNDEIIAEMRGSKKMPTIDAEESSFPNWTNINVEITKKENGKNSLFMIIEHHIPGETKRDLYVIGGSKNVMEVHKMNSEGIQTVSAPSADAYYHSIIMYEFLKIFYNLSKEQIAILLNRTIVAEFVDNRGMFYVEKNYLAFFNAPKNAGLPMIDVVYSGNKIPTHDELSVMRNRLDEGVVIKITNIETGEIQSLKFKSYWYIFLRAFREMVRHTTKKSINLISFKDNIIEKLTKKNADYTKLGDEFKPILNTILVFYKRILESNYDFCDLDGYETKNGLGVVYHNLMKNYTYTGTTEVNSIIDDLSKMSINNYNYPAFVDAVSNPHNIDVILQQITKMRITIIMRGSSRTGKSTLAHKIADWCLSTNYSCDIFSADNYFITDGKYVYDATKLPDAHKDCQNKFLNSSAYIRIIDNTNMLIDWYSYYINKSIEQNSYPVVLQTHLPSLEELLSRENGHISNDVIKKLYNPRPWLNWMSYYGIVFSNDFTDFLKSHNINASIQLPHITIKYCPNSPDGNLDNYLGNMISVEITGLYNGPEGIGMIVDPNTVSLAMNIGADANKPFHITVMANKGYKPADIGIAIARNSGNIKAINKIIVSGMFIIV
jgi:hypothetical protein